MGRGWEHCGFRRADRSEAHLNLGAWQPGCFSNQAGGQGSGPVEVAASWEPGCGLALGPGAWHYCTASEGEGLPSSWYCRSRSAFSSHCPFLSLLLYLLAFLFPQSRKCRFESPLGWGVEVGLASFWTMSLALRHRNGFSD